MNVTWHRDKHLTQWLKFSGHDFTLLWLISVTKPVSRSSRSYRKHLINHFFVFCIHGIHLTTDTNWGNWHNCTNWKWHLFIILNIIIPWSQSWGEKRVNVQHQACHTRLSTALGPNNQKILCTSAVQFLIWNILEHFTIESSGTFSVHKNSIVNVDSIQAVDSWGNRISDYCVKWDRTGSTT